MVLVVLGLAAGSCAGPRVPSEGGDSREPAIEREPPAQAKLGTRVKIALVEDPQIDAAAVFVETPGNGRVRLGGFVDNAAERRRAEAIARDVAGVASIDNAIEIR
jgi:hypothetical protein